MTYCVGVKLEEGLIFASDSRTNAGVDNYARFCKMTVFERVGDRVLVLLSSGALAGTQAVINVLRRRATGKPPHIWSVESVFDVANLVSDAMRDIERRDGPFLEASGPRFNASFVLGGQIVGEAMQSVCGHAHRPALLRKGQPPRHDEAPVRPGRRVLRGTDQAMAGRYTKSLPRAAGTRLARIDLPGRADHFVAAPASVCASETASAFRSAFHVAPPWATKR